MKTHVIVDAGTIAYWKLYSLVSKSKGYSDLEKNIYLMKESDAGFPHWKAEFQHAIVDLINLFNPDKLTIACDGSKLWRKHFYPEYKANRKAQRTEVPIDWDLFGKTRDEMLADLPNIYPIKSIYVKHAEADDIIAVLTKKYHQEEEIIAVTGDADIHQLFRFPNFRCYNARDNREVFNIDWQDLLQVKILSGDRGDNIKPLRPRLGPVTARKIITECEGDLHSYCSKNELLEQLTLNEKLVNFEFIPNKLQEMILESYENAIIKIPTGAQLAMNSILEYSEATTLFNRKLFNP